MKRSYLLICAIAILITCSTLYKANAQGAQFRTQNIQSTTPLGQETDRRVISTAVPFLSISPDARAAGMGDVGAATSPDVNSQHWNAAKYPFATKNSGVSISYTPWLSRLINDMSISYLSGYKKISKTQVIGVSMKYFNLGNVNLRDDFGLDLGNFNPREFAFDASYSQKLSDNLAIAGTLRFIYSNLIGNVGSSASQAKAGVSGAVDIGLYGQKELFLKTKNAKWSYGLVFSNVGRKLTYGNADQKDFIPMNLRLGTAFTTELDLHNKFVFALDLNKLMVPSPQTDSAKIEKAKTQTMMSGLISSFGDAPGGLKEELQEIMFSFGAEYWYNDMFSGRVGYFYENRFKGNRKYLTFGLGLRYHAFVFDVAYMVPQKQNNPLAETLRFTLGFVFDKKDNSSNVNPDIQP